MTSNWAIEYTLESALVVDSITPIAGTTNENVESAGYWQWANAYMTVAESSFTSFSLMSNIVAGYPEISYWQTAWFNTQTNIANVATFASVKLYVDAALTTGNYEFLFSTDSLETRSLYYPGNL
jgi:hypothetical protein